MIGETLGGRYSIVRLLGEGGMGSVYEARHTGTNRRVAVKVIAGELLKHANIVARFQLEARAAGTIDSQHIARASDVGVDPKLGVPYLVMEFLQGEDLHRLMQRLGALPQDLVVRIAAQAAIGLSKAHEVGVVHRDIKPANVFLAQQDGDDMVVKLLDFGIAKVKMDEAQRPEAGGLTRTGNLIGTPLYMSPEQASGDKAIDARADVWSLGVVMYQMLSGKTPHHEVDAVGKLIITICSHRARPVQVLAPWVEPALADVVDQCLELEPNDRFQTAEELFSALRSQLSRGTAIRAPMLVSLGDPERGLRAPATRRSHQPSASPARESKPRAEVVIVPPHKPQVAHEGTLASPVTPEGAASTVRDGLAPATTGAVSSDRSAPPPAAQAPRSLAWMGLGAVGTIAAGVMVFRMVAGPAPSETSPATPPPTARAESAPTLASPPPTSAPTAAARPGEVEVTAVPDPTTQPGPAASSASPVSGSASRPSTKPPPAAAKPKPKPTYDPTKQM